MNVDGKHGKSHRHNWDLTSKAMLFMGVVFCVFLNLGFILGVPLMGFAYIRSKSDNIDTEKEKELFLRNGANGISKWAKSCMKQGIKSVYNGEGEKEKTYTTIICPGCMRRLRVRENRGNIRICCPVCSHKFRAKT